MSKEQAEAVKAAEDKFKRVSKALKQAAWFKKGGWKTSVHPFPRKNPTGITFHVFKANWFNEDSSGIHIESHLDLDLKKQKKTYLTIHLLHEDKIPGTQIKRMELSKPVVDEVFATISKWPGYRFRVGKYGQQPFTLFLDGTAKTFEADLESEVTRLCKLMGPIIDKTLADLFHPSA
jgi:hypothetical protein